MGNICSNDEIVSDTLQVHVQPTTRQHYEQQHNVDNTTNNTSALIHNNQQWRRNDALQTHQQRSTTTTSGTDRHPHTNRFHTRHSHPPLSPSHSHTSSRAHELNG